MMAGIKGRDTRPEILLRRGLHSRGLRFRLHDKRLPGKPDIVLPRFRAVVLAHGCFWHGHDCALFKWPSTRPEFWREKIARNRHVDARNQAALNAAGWRVLTVWECAFKGRGRRDFDNVITRAEQWIRDGEPDGEIRGTM